MRASGDWTGDAALPRADLFNRLRATHAELDVAQARQETSRFIRSSYSRCASSLERSK